MAASPLSESDITKVALCFANNPNNVADVVITYVDGTKSSGWYASRVQLGAKMIITLTSRPEAPPRPTFDLDWTKIAHILVLLSSGEDVPFGTRPPDAPDVALDKEFRRLTAVIDAFTTVGIMDKALESHKQLADAMDRMAGPKHPFTVAAHANFGEALRRASRMDEARVELERAVAAARETWPKTDVNRARTVSSLGTWHFDHGDYAQARALFAESLEGYLASTPRSPDVAEMLDSLGLCDLRTGDQAGAAANFRQAVDMFRLVGAQRNSGYPRALHNLGVVYAQAQGYREGFALLQESLDIRRNLFGDRHPDTMESLGSLGTFWLVQGNVAQAEPLYRQALAIAEGALGERHLVTAERCMDVAICAKYKRTFQAAQEAAPLILRAYSTRRAILGDAHPLVQQTAQELDAVNRALGLG